MKYNFPITKTQKPKAKPDPDTLRFGTEFTDHMFIMEYEDGKGWHDGRIVPYGPLSPRICGPNFRCAARGITAPNCSTTNRFNT